jgi:flagellar basal body rod protein FlgC
MSDVYNTALSGLNAAQTRLNVSANNIANLTTPDAPAKEAVARSVQVGGVVVDVRDKSPATIAVPSSDGGGDTIQLPNVSLEQEVTKQLTASYDYKANLKIIKTQRDMDRSLLNIQA